MKTLHDGSPPKPVREGFKHWGVTLGRVRLFVGVDWLFNPNKARLPLNDRARRDWDRNKRRANPFAGLKVWSRCDNGRILLLSRHWPHRLCWSWFLEWSPVRRDRGELYGIGISGGNRWHQKLHIGLGFGRIDFVKQSYDYMLVEWPPHSAPRAIYPEDVTHQEGGHA